MTVTYDLVSRIIMSGAYPKIRRVDASWDGGGYLTIFGSL